VKQKIICIGLPKTGTVSFCKALRKLGFSARHSLVVKEQRHRRLLASSRKKDELFRELLVRQCREGASTFSFPCDWFDEDYWYKVLERKDSIAEIYGLIDFEKIKEQYPNARLVWTKRDLEPWLMSCARQFGEFGPKGGRRNLSDRMVVNRKYRFGRLFFEREAFIKIYLNFYERVENYKFDNPLENILEMDITKGDGYEKLCPFLNVPSPSSKFPHCNKNSYRP
jgi:hypothetical protein